MGNYLPHDADSRAGVVQRLRGALVWRVGNKSPLLLSGTIILAVLLYLGRRPDQLIAPMVWAEETAILGRWYGGPDTVPPLLVGVIICSQKPLRGCKKENH